MRSYKVLSFTIRIRCGSKYESIKGIKNLRLEVYNNSVASLYTWIERTTNAQLFFIEMKRSIVKETLHPLWLSCCRFLLSWRGALYKRGGLLKLMTDLAQARGAGFLAFYLQLWFLYKHSER